MHPGQVMEELHSRAIAQALKGLRFGTVQLVVHEGKVIRIERLERIRLVSESKEMSRPDSPEALFNIRRSDPS